MDFLSISTRSEKGVDVLKTLIRECFKEAKILDLRFSRGRKTPFTIVGDRRNRWSTLWLQISGCSAQSFLDFLTAKGISLNSLSTAHGVCYNISRLDLKLDKSSDYPKLCVHEELGLFKVKQEALELLRKSKRVMKIRSESTVAIFCSRKFKKFIQGGKEIPLEARTNEKHYSESMTSLGPNHDHYQRICLREVEGTVFFYYELELHHRNLTVLSGLLLNGDWCRFYAYGYQRLMLNIDRLADTKLTRAFHSYKEAYGVLLVEQNLI